MLLTAIQLATQLAAQVQFFLDALGLEEADFNVEIRKRSGLFEIKVTCGAGERFEIRFPAPSATHDETGEARTGDVPRRR